jgi:hypothetical protein
VTIGSDSYIRFFNFRAIKVIYALNNDHKNGKPLCLDFSSDRLLMAVGYENDSFITYCLEVRDLGMSMRIIPVAKGVGHRNFVRTLSFDNFYFDHQKNFVNIMKSQQNELSGNISTNEIIESEPGINPVQGLSYNIKNKGGVKEE